MSERFRLADHPPAGWDGLVRDDPNATPAHRPELWRVLADARPGGSVAFIAAEENGVLLGGTGLVIERYAGFRWLRALPWMLSGAPLARPGEHARVDRAVAEGFAALRHDVRPIGGEWALYRPGDPAPDPAAFEILAGETTHVETGLVDLTNGIDAVHARLGRRLRQYLRNDARAFAFADDPAALEEVYVLHTRQARLWSGFTPLPIELSRRLLAAGRVGTPLAGASGDGSVAHAAPPALPPLARLFTLRDSGRLLAATLFLDHPRELFAWWSGIHPRARGRHVFPVLLWKAVEWAAQRGRTRVNLGGSAGRASLIAFKEALGAEDRSFPVRWLSAAGAPAAGRMIARLQHWRRRQRPRGRVP